MVDQAKIRWQCHGMATNSGLWSFKSRIHPFNPLVFVITCLFLLTLGNLDRVVAAAQEGFPPQIASFITQKEKQARALAMELDLKISEDVWAYFQTAHTGNGPAITNAFERLKERASQYRGSRDDPTVGTPVWQTVIEVELAVDAYEDGDPKYCTAFGTGVINSIPPGGIYFGGTDPGRGLVTALCKSHADGDPFFTITQNALADERYLEYLRAMYGAKIRIPSTKDSQEAFEEYLTDAQQRLANNKLKPGEDVRIVNNNRVQVSGQVAVMSINGLLAKNIFEANPDREFYVEESFPLDWMYPHLVPHQLIFKINRQPLEGIPEGLVLQDRKFWTQQQAQLIGDWLTPETSVQKVCDFALKVYGSNDLTGFKGDRRFVQNDYSIKLYSKLRSSIGGLYQWHATNTKSTAERKRMTAEADFAFRQAFAFCPRSPEAIFRYVNLLVANARTKEALLVATTAQTLEPNSAQLKNLVVQLTQEKQPEDK
jgi:hypothetical protein